VVNERDSERDAGQILRLRSGIRSAASEVASSSDLFAILWNALADMLGTAAAATLVRRAARRAAKRYPELADLGITRQSLDYHCEVPAIWKGPGAGPSEGLRELARELSLLLRDLTGNVVIDRLAQIPELRDKRVLVADPEEQS
jgi:hypothetical protein